MNILVISIVIARRYKILLIECLLMACILLGCTGNKRQATWSQQHSIIEEQDRLYRIYLSTNLDGAKQALQIALTQLDQDTYLERAGRAHDLFLNYSRLYVLHKRSGDTNNADIDFIKARYWFLQGGELEKLSKEEIEEQLERFDAEGIAAMVDKQDKDSTDQRGPLYEQNLGK